MELVLKLCALIILSSPVDSITQAEYHKLRNEIKAKHQKEIYGSELQLSGKEEKVNQILLSLKKEEITEGISSQTFPPALPFLRAKPLIEKSKIFKILKIMPKGGALHIHDLAMIDPWWLVEELTYRKGCQMCRNGNKIFAFSFESEPDKEEGCEWILLETAREETTDVEDFDEIIWNHLYLEMDNKYTEFHGNEDDRIWENAASCWKLASELIFTEQNLGDYYYESLRQFAEDGVQYMEIRSLLMSNAAKIDFEQQEKFVQIFKEVTERFKKENSDYLGSKLIKCDLRIFDVDAIQKSLSTTMEWRQKYPGFIAGYDLVAQEDLGIPLEQYLDALLKPSQSNPLINLPYFFHAGETNWQHTHIDWNLLDAILLNTTRIGHGFALLKHPTLAKMVKNKDIAIEVNPVSNQVLGYISDPRNHPVTLLLANNFPIVVSSDDPALWRSLPMSHDFYYIFMANTGLNAGLRVLKKLALNSLEYSAMSYDEKGAAMSLFHRKWDQFIDNVLEEYY